MNNKNKTQNKTETRTAQTPHSFERWAFEQMNEEALGHAEMVLQVVFNDRLDRIVANLRREVEGALHDARKASWMAYDEWWSHTHQGGEIEGGE